MNLASILNLTAATPPQPGIPNGAAPADTAMLAEFAALLGLTAEAATGGKDLPDMGGNSLPDLPPDLPVALPEVLLALPTVPMLTLEQIAPAKGADPAATPAGRTAPLLTALPMATPPAAPALPSAPTTPSSQTIPAPAMQVPQAEPAPAAQFTAAPPVTSQQATPQVLDARPVANPVLLAVPLPIQQQTKMPPAVPVLAQVQAATILAEQAQSPEPTRQQLVAASLAAAPEIQKVAMPESAKPSAKLPAQPSVALIEHADLLPRAARTADKPGASSPAASSAAAAPAAAPAAAAPFVPTPTLTPQLADLPRAASVDTQAASVTSTSPADRHDFTAIVEALTEARELARPGRAAMQLAHRDFGQISVQFDMAGPALKVAMTSPDAGFAPAVEAALSERPIAALADSARADSPRSDNQSQRFDQPTAASTAASSGPAGQQDSQRGDPNGRQAAPRHPTEQVRGNGQPARDGGEDSAASRARDGNLFA